MDPFSLDPQRPLGRSQLLEPLHLVHQALLELSIKGRQLGGPCVLCCRKAGLVPRLQLGAVCQQGVVPAPGKEGQAAAGG